MAYSSLIPNVITPIAQGGNRAIAAAWHRWLRTLDQAPPPWVTALNSKSVSMGSNSIPHGLAEAPNRWAIVADDAVPVFVEAFKSAAQSVPSGAGTQVEFDGETTDWGGDFASNTFTAPHAGIYRFGGTVSLENINDGTSVLTYWDFSTAGLRIVDAGAIGVGSADVARLLSHELALASGETAKAYIEHDHGSARSIGTTAVKTSLSIRSDETCVITGADATNLTVYSARARTLSIWVWNE